MDYPNTSETSTGNAEKSDETDSQPTHRDASPLEKAKGSLPLTRRTTLLAILGLGGYTAMTDSTKADRGEGQEQRESSKELPGEQAQARGPPGGSSGGSRGGGTRPWRTDVDAQGNSLLNLGSLTMADNTTAITDFEGENLLIDDNGILYVNDGPGSKLDADTLDGLQRAALEQRIAELEAKVEANRNFAESAATQINANLSKIETFVNDDLGAVEQTLNSGLGEIQSKFNSAAGSIENSVNTVIEKFNNALNTATTDIENTVDDISNALQSVDSKVNTALGDIEGTVNTIIGDLNEAFDAAANDIETTLNRLFSDLQAVDSVVNDILSTIEGTLNSILDDIESTINDIIGVVTLGAGNKIDIPDLELPSLNLSSITVNLPDFNIGELSLPELNLSEISVDLPDFDIDELSLPRISELKVTIPELTLPKLDETVDDS